MPVETRISLEFGKIITDALKDNTYGQASIKTGISQAYILAMARGKVPSEPIIEKFAKGMNCDLDELMIAAGYKEPEPKDVLKNVIACLRGTNPTPEADRQIKEFIAEQFKKYKK